LQEAIVHDALVQLATAFARSQARPQALQWRGSWFVFVSQPFIGLPSQLP
jgi:hypothetical protein